jgi:hypothetical protein
VNILDDQRRLEEALADLVQKYDQIPKNDPARPELERMIRSLEAEIAERNRAR